MMDRLGRNITYLRISVTELCNLRCRYCMPAEGICKKSHHDMMTEDEIINAVEAAASLGITKLRITGGEPLLHADMPEFLAKVKELGFKIKLDTNGSFPDRLIEIVNAGLVDRVAMDIKNPPELYARTVGLEKLDMEAIERSKNFLLEGRVEYEFRTTVVKGLHTEESIRQAAKWIEGAKEYYLQQFKDSGDIIALEGLGAYGEKEMHELCGAVRPIVPSVEVRGV